ncbi:MAG: glycine cleavage system aminomethyltransferase GcvT [Bacteroidales bacterium]|nr:glycine cleavage system aminomethyltransferase GcvT [Bacteroidales bacterium]
MSVKQTAFHDIHVKLGARMVEFAGFRMPLEYTGVTDEHIAVRTGVGVFDVSHMGEIWVRGPHALDLVQKITTNDASVLTPGKVQYSCMPNGKGGIVDDLLVYCFDGQTYLLVVNAANIEKDWKWIVEQNSMGAILENASDNISQLAVQGPKATEILQELTSVSLSDLKYYTFTTGEIAGVPGVIISATGYTGAGGFELYFPNAFAEKIWNSVFEAGKKAGIKPAGLAARDTLRLEMGYCLYGNDIDDTTSPIEAGLGWITKFTEGKNFIDRDLLWKQKQNGVARKLVGFEMVERGIPRQHYAIADATGNRVGEVTSGTMSPMLKKGIGMGYVKTELSASGTEIFVIIREKPVKAVVVKPPFYKPQ